MNIIKLAKSLLLFSDNVQIKVHVPRVKESAIHEKALNELFYFS